MQILDMPSPNYSSRDGAIPRWLIIHGTAGGASAQAIGAYFATSTSQVSSHYVVGLDGTIVRCVPENLAAWANGPISGPAGTSGDGIHHDAWWDSSPKWGGLPNPNPVTISIEHVKPDTANATALTAAQQAASFMLIKDICTRQKIPMRAANAQGGITGHYSMDPVNRSRCPGTYPWSALWTFLQQGGGMIPKGWTDNGTTLTAPIGHKVVQGFRTRIIEDSSWDPANVPLEEEHGMGAAGGTQQTFTLNALRWTSANGVTLADLGTQYLAAEAQVAALQSQIAGSANTQLLAGISKDLQAIAASAADAEATLAKL